MNAKHSFFALTLAFGLLAGCAEPGDLVDQTKTNLVDKSIFEGEWWYTRTVADLDDDAAWAISSAGAGAPWPGAMANFDIVSESGIIGRIRWVIDEDFLYAFRSHEIIAGSAANADDDEFIGSPLAIFPIDGHTDVRRNYDSFTGEQTNVLVENTDRRWYDRQYMRVDWSRNLVTMGLFGDSLQISGLFAQFIREPVDNFVQEGGDGRVPDTWRPQFVRIGEDDEYRLRDEWPTGTEETVHYMSFVTNELWTPTNCNGTACNTSIHLALRNSFLRIPPNHEYAAETLENDEYDRFGVIRTESRTYIRGGADRSDIARYCDARCTERCDIDDHCGVGGLCGEDGFCAAGAMEDVDDCGAGTMCDFGTGLCQGNVDLDCGPGMCNLETNTCEGGLTPARGETDFLTYRRLRHNFYADSLTDRECQADWQCDNRYGTIDGADPNTTDGSVCDAAANRCTVPLRNRPIRPVNYTLSPHYPRHLVRSAFDITGQWNETFMRGNRGVHGRPIPSGDRVTCQNTNPTDYCYCGEHATAGEVGPDMTCAHRSDFFVPPEMRGESEPFDCWIALVDENGNPSMETEATNPTHPTSNGDYSADVYRYAFVGDECMFKLRVNDCDVPVADGEEPRACNELGDIRYQFFNYASGAGAGWCGVMQPLQDPVSGEAISIPINMGGLCLNSVANVAVNLWPVLRGEVPEDTLYSGEHVRGYFERLGSVHNPIGMAPAVDGSDYEPDDLGRPAIPLDLNGHINEMFAAHEDEFSALAAANGGSAQLHSARVRQLAGTGIERRLVSGLANEGLAALTASNPLRAHNLDADGVPDMDSEAMLDMVSPFRDGGRDMLVDEHMREMALADNYIYYPRDAIFTSRYNQWWAEAFRGYSLEEAHIRWTQAYHRVVMLHEMGHGIGLEHNFAASFDRDHYGDGYFGIVTRRDGDAHPMALPEFNEFDCGRDGLCPDDEGYPGADDGEADNILTDLESAAWASALREVRTARAEAGIGNYMTASLMDYNGDNSDQAGLGHYDRAAVYFNYFNLAEAFDGDATYTEAGDSNLVGLQRSDTTARTMWSWYRGGESCDVDNDCPYAAGSQALTSEQPIYQRCIRNPRYSNLPTPCDGDRNCVCSTFDEDFTDYVDGAAYRTSRDPLDFTPVRYLFCSNPRLNDISWCNAFDAGESFQEVVDHYRQMWQERYPSSYFRNFRRNFFAGSRAQRWIIDASKIFQHLFFRYFNEPEFRRSTGPLGFNDQYLASIDSMNWLAELAQLPEVGSYRLELAEGPEACHPTDPEAAGNPEGCRYHYAFLGEDMDMDGSDVNLEPGQGFHHWSRYQDGLYGYFRMERAGVFWDKLLALRALTTRDWGLSFTIDERYFINFYNLFPIEMTELFGGYVINDDSWIAPRLQMNGDNEPDITYLNYLRGTCSNSRTGERGPCRPSNAESFTTPAIAGTSNEILRLYAAIYALAEFPVYYDPSFESRLAVFKLDDAAGFTIPDVQTDGEPTQAFGAAIPGSGHALTTDAADADYIIYDSDRLHTPYVAVKVRERLTFNLEEEQLGFQLLLRVTEQQNEVRRLEALAAPTADERAQLARARRQLQGSESFLEALIEVQGIFGITSIF